MLELGVSQANHGVKVWEFYLTLAQQEEPSQESFIPNSVGELGAFVGLAKPAAGAG